MTRPLLSAACVMTAATTMLGLGTALAHADVPSVTGQKYGDATSVISGAGLRAVVSTTVGDQKAWSDCLVSSQQERDVPPPENSSGSVTKELLVSLNCDAAPATSTTPGYSAASPEAKAIKSAAAAKS